MPHSAILNVMIKAAYRAGRSLKRDLGEIENLQVSLKGPRNFVTAADRKAEAIVREELAKARPDYGFLGEEGGAHIGADKTHRWIVDPLDGTTNFLHGIPHFAVSIALERNGTIVAGLTYNPANDELFVAERGKGAFLNDRRIRVAARKRLTRRSWLAGCHIMVAATSRGRAEIAAAQQHSPACAGSAPPRLISPGSPPAASTLIGNAICRRGIWLPGSCWSVRPAALSAISTAAKKYSSKSQIAAGNDTMHRELLRLLREAGKEPARQPAAL